MDISCERLTIKRYPSLNQQRNIMEWMKQQSRERHSFCFDSAGENSQFDKSNCLNKSNYFPRIPTVAFIETTLYYLHIDCLIARSIAEDTILVETAVQCSCSIHMIYL